MTTRTWIHRAGAGETRIAANLLVTAVRPEDQTVEVMADCDVDMAAEHDARAPVILKWLGPAIVKQGDCSFPGCAYHEVDGRRMPIDGDAEYIAAEAAEGVMTLVYEHNDGHTRLSLSRLRRVRAPLSLQH
jgi:hypothetical protein